MRHSPAASGRFAKYEAAALYLLLFILLFGVHVANADILFPDPGELTGAPAYAGAPETCDTIGLASDADAGGGEDDDLP